MGELRTIPLSEFGLLTVEGAAARRGWAVPTVQRWIQRGLLPVVVVGDGRNRKHLLREVDVDAFSPPPMGAPKGNRNAAARTPGPPAPAKKSAGKKPKGKK
jgi:hypothetical protein